MNAAIAASCAGKRQLSWVKKKEFWHWSLAEHSGSIASAGPLFAL